MEFAGEPVIPGGWDIRGLFPGYIGNYDIVGKTLRYHRNRVVEVEEGRTLHVQFPARADHEIEQPALDLAAVRADQDIGDLLVQQVEAGLDNAYLAPWMSM